MSKPNIVVDIQPQVGGKIVFLRCAPASAQGAETGRVLLTMKLRNKSVAAITCNTLRVSFPGSAAAAVEVPMKAGQPLESLQLPGTVTTPEGGSNAVEWGLSAAQDIVLPLGASPAPAQIRIEIVCAGFSEPWAADFPLAAHANANPKQSYLFPASARDLRPGEYWVVGTASHGAGGYTGSQSFAYDFDVCAFDGGAWTMNLKAVADVQQTNANFRIWNKPVLAMADGEVISFADGVPTNPDPPTYDSNAYQTGGTTVGSGNHFLIRHGDEQVQYAHLQKGTLNASLLVKGAVVKAGQFLGLAGNAGNASRPHLHFDAKADDTTTANGHTRPIVLRDCWVLRLKENAAATPDSAWVKVDHRGLPVRDGDAEANVRVAVWPYPTKPTWFPPECQELTFYGVPEAGYQRLFDKAVSSGLRLEWIDAFEVGSQACFNVIFRPAGTLATRAFHGLGSTDYQTLFNEWVEDKGYRLASLTSYFSGGTVRHAGIFMKSPGPAQAAFHGRSDADFITTRAALEKQGYAAMNLSAVSVAGQRVWAGYFERGLPGTTVLERELTESQYQTAFDLQKAAGRGLAFASAYNHQGAPRIVAIWHDQAPRPEVAYHGMSGAFYQEQHDKQAEAGRFTRAVVGYARGNTAAYLAWWHK